ncbi:MAG: isoamylase early set domain-containing protein [Gemmatimonadaceae bacterium]|nr:isoamylase early set domain-containing protein [Gemmatimonadaceae bacterium]
MTAPQDDNEPTGPLARAIVEMRQDVPVRDAWHAALDEALAQTAPDPVTLARGWHVSRPVAAAAAIAFMCVGASLQHLVQRARAASLPIVDESAAPMSPTTSTMGVRFSVMAAGVRRVSLVGDFNAWNADATPLELGSDGRTWSTLLPLPAGRHAYAFVIDGQVVRDPGAPAEAEEDFGVPNSIVLVSSAR